MRQSPDVPEKGETKLDFKDNLPGNTTDLERIRPIDLEQDVYKRQLYASRMTIAGNIGVYMTAVSEAELYKKVGVELEYIATGENKVPGYPELTDEQREIYKAMIEELSLIHIWEKYIMTACVKQSCFAD